MSTDKWITLSTYYNNRTGFLTLKVVILNYNDEVKSRSVKLVFSISPVKEGMKQAKPGSKGVYDFDKTLSFAISESELAQFVHFLQKNLYKPVYEFKFSGHFNDDKTKVSNLFVQKNEGYTNTMFSLYSNKKNPNGETVKCAVAETDMYALFENLRSVLSNLVVLKTF